MKIDRKWASATIQRAIKTDDGSHPVDRVFITGYQEGYRAALEAAAKECERIGARFGDGFDCLHAIRALKVPE